MTRLEIRLEIARKEKDIESLRREINALHEQDMLLCDEEQWYKELTDYYGRKIGIIYWYEYIVIGHGEYEQKLESKVVRVNGVWVD